MVTGTTTGAATSAARSLAPLASVIIATYNWSAALACAIRSVLRQTMRDYEILVVGDGCTDDSEAIVAALGDPRIRWSNLARNTGSQQGPNNHGLDAARGEWIAYLGHDDIWAPRHLESTIAAARARGSQLAAGGMIMYGPPGTGVTWTAGLFVDGRCTDVDFVPPSALVHRRALVDEIGRWIDPRTLRMPTDCDFFLRARAASAVASSGEVTAFKFNAAARRNAYQVKSTMEQVSCLANLERGDRFVAEELAKVCASAAAGRSRRIVLPNPAAVAPGEIFRANRIAKGVEHRFADAELRTLAKRERFGVEREATGYEWHALEHDARFGAFRWTGPSERSTVELPVRLRQEGLSLGMHLRYVLDPRSLQDLAVDAQGVPIETRIERTGDSGWLVSGTIDPARCASPVPYIQLTLRGATRARPVDLGINGDARTLGVAVDWIELGPIERSPAGDSGSTSPLEVSGR